MYGKWLERIFADILIDCVRVCVCVIFQGGFGKNGTLFVLKPSRAVLSCKKIDRNWEHRRVQRFYTSVLHTGTNCSQEILQRHPAAAAHRLKLIEAIWRPHAAWGALVL